MPEGFLNFAISLKYYLHYNIPLMNPQHNTTTHNNKKGTLTLPSRALPSAFSMRMAAAPATHGAAAPYGPIQGAHHQVTRWRLCWFPCLGRQRKPHKK